MIDGKPVSSLMNAGLIVLQRNMDNNGWYNWCKPTYYHVIYSVHKFNMGLAQPINTFALNQLTCQFPIAKILSFGHLKVCTRAWKQKLNTTLLLTGAPETKV